MIVLGGEEDMEAEEKEDGAEAVLHFTSNILLHLKNPRRILDDSTGHSRNTKIVFSFRKPFLISRKPPSINAVNR